MKTTIKNLVMLIATDILYVLTSVLDDLLEIVGMLLTIVGTLVREAAQLVGDILDVTENEIIGWIQTPLRKVFHKMSEQKKQLRRALGIYL